MEKRYVLGVDFGTDSVRAVVVDAATGKEDSSEVAYYRRWAQGLYCNPAAAQFRQHPLDYVESLEECVRGALAKLPGDVADWIVGIGIDTTGSTPCAADERGVPLGIYEEFADNPNAMFILWKDHAAVREAEDINRTARTWGGIDYTKYEGGVYSAEWFWAKILHVLRTDERIREAAFSWVEHCDWIPALLTGVRSAREIKRSRCAAGHKAMWHEEWGGLPSEDFLTRVDPLLAGVRDRLYVETCTSDQKAGELTGEWAERLGLRPGIAVAVGALDAHMGAVGGGISAGTLVKIMGTSTCDIMVAPPELVRKQPVRGICGQVDGSVIPGMIGLEAGQSAFGDIYAWFKDVLSWSLKEFARTAGAQEASQIRDFIDNRLLPRLTEDAARVPIEETGLLALDWLNGRRTPFADQTLKGAILGLTLATTAPKMFRALVEATAFAAKAIVDRFRAEGLEIKEVVAQGGVAKKNHLVMQITADVLNMPVKVVRSEQACALGAAMFAAVVAGIYGSVADAQAHMCSGYIDVYYPNPENAAKYQKLYERYLAVGSALEDHLRAL